MNHAKRQQRKRRMKDRVRGTNERPRASVFRGANSLTVQLINDAEHATLVSASTTQIKGKKKLTKTDKAKEVGKQVAQVAKEKGIAKIVFDRGGYQYHGRVRALAEAMREEGLEF